MPEKIQKESPDCPEDLIKICNRMIQKKAAKRFQTAREVAEVLERWLEKRGYDVNALSGDSSVKVANLASVGGGQKEARAQSGQTPAARKLPKAKPLPAGGSGVRGVSATADTASEENSTNTKIGPDDARERPSNQKNKPKLPVAQPLDGSDVAAKSDAGSGVLSGTALDRKKGSASGRQTRDSNKSASNSGSSKIDLGVEMADTAEVKDALDAQSSDTSLMDQRRTRRQTRQVQIPISLWITLGTFVALAVALGIYMLVT